MDPILTPALPNRVTAGQRLGSWSDRCWGSCTGRWGQAAPGEGEGIPTQEPVAESGPR